jgi:germination protein M
MMWRALAVAGAVVLLLAFGAGVWMIGHSPAPPAVVRGSDTDASPAPTSHITATLFFGDAGGRGLVARRVDVPLGASVADQGEAILLAALSTPPPGTVAVVPVGTRVRAFYLDGTGTGFVDLSGEVRTKHPGGSFAEALTVAAVVNAVTSNLPSVARVRVLVEGKEVETLAGHLDLAEPFLPDLSLVVGRTTP